MDPALRAPGARRPAVAALAAAAAALLLGLLVLDLRDFAVDDSFIFFRYADNLAAGNGFAFNAGEAPGEGFTSWAWLLLLAAARRAGASPLAAARLLGLLSHLLAAGMLYRLAKRLAGEGSAATGAALAVAAGLLLNYRLVAHSLSGMETALYGLAVTLLALVTVAALQAPADSLAWLKVAGAGLAAFAVRPEGLAAAGLSLLALAIARRRELLRPRPWLLATAGLLLPLALFLWWKTAHFGWPLPHSFYHKRIVHSVEYGESLRQLGLFLRSYGWLLLAAAAAAAAAARRGRWAVAYPPALFLPLAGLYLLFYPAMNYLHRFYAPYLPLLLAGTAPLLAGLFRRLRRVPGRAGPAAARAALALLLVAGLNWDAPGARATAASWARMVDPAVNRGRLGRLMAGLPPGLVVANTEMGVIPYFSGLACIDMAGLTDPHIAHRGLTMEYLERRGVALILFPEDATALTPDGWKRYSQNYAAVFRSARFRRDFVSIGSVPAWPGGKRGYFLYADRRSPLFPALSAWGCRHAAAPAGG